MSQLLDRPHGLRPWLALLATLAALLSPAAAAPAEGPAITLSSDGGDAWTFEKRVAGTLPDGGCDEVLVASPRATPPWRPFPQRFRLRALSNASLCITGWGLGGK